MSLLNYSVSGVAFTDEPHSNIGSGALILNHDAFYPTDFIVRTAAGGGGTLLVKDTDYTLNGQSTTRAEATIYSQVNIINGAYQTGTLYFSGKYAGDFASGNHLNQIISGWIPFSATITRVSNTSFTANLNYSEIIQKGYGLRLVQHGVTKYFYNAGAVTYSAPNSTFANVIGNDAAGNVVVIEDTTTYPITNAYWTPNPSGAFGFPKWFNWSPTYGAGGSMTWTSINTEYAKFKINGNELKYVIKAIGTTGSSASNTLTFSLPVARNNSIAYLSAGHQSPMANNTINSGYAVFANTSTTVVNVYFYNNGSWGTYANSGIDGQGFYEI